MPTPAQALAWDANAVLLALALVGLVARDRVRLSWAFSSYLVACFLSNRLIALWPMVFWNYAFYDVKESAYTVLKVAIAWEVALLTFARTPAPRRAALLLLSGVTIAAVSARWLAPASRGGPDLLLVVSGFVSPVGHVGTLWLFLVVILVALRHRVALHPFHRALVIGFALYMTSAGCLQALLRVAETGERRSPWLVYPFLVVADPLLYAATVGLWTFAAWRVRWPSLAPALRRHLEPRAVP